MLVGKRLMVRRWAGASIKITVAPADLTRPRRSTAVRQTMISFLFSKRNRMSFVIGCKLLRTSRSRLPPMKFFFLLANLFFLPTFTAAPKAKMNLRQLVRKKKMMASREDFIGFSRPGEVCFSISDLPRDAPVEIEKQK